MANNKLQPGENWYSIQLDAKNMLWEAHKALLNGKDRIAVPAFINKDKQQGDSLPNLKGDGVAVWKNQKKPEQNVQSEDV